MGIVDATPIRHLAPIASSYGTAEAVEEGRQMLERLGISRSGKQILQSSKLL
jgi:hypothetical protein